MAHDRQMPTYFVPRQSAHMPLATAMALAAKAALPSHRLRAATRVPAACGGDVEDGEEDERGEEVDAASVVAVQLRPPHDEHLPRHDPGRSTARPGARNRMFSANPSNRPSAPTVRGSRKTPTRRREKGSGPGSRKLTGARPRKAPTLRRSARGASARPWQRQPAAHTNNSKCRQGAPSTSSLCKRPLVWSQVGAPSPGRSKMRKEAHAKLSIWLPPVPSRSWARSTPKTSHDTPPLPDHCPLYKHVAGPRAEMPVARHAAPACCMWWAEVEMVRRSILPGNSGGQSRPKPIDIRQEPPKLGRTH